MSPLASTIACQGVAQRLDVGPFQIFVARYNPAGRRYEHGHEDCLSYVIYLDGEPLLIDPGRPTYQPGEVDWMAPDLHCGLYRPGLPLVPRASSLTPPRWRHPAISFDSPQPGTWRWQVRNAPLRRWKSLTISGVERDLIIEEQVWGTELAQFTWLFSPEQVLKDAAGAVAGNGWQADFEGLIDLRLEEGWCALDYASPAPCSRLTAVANFLTRARIRSV